MQPRFRRVGIALLVFGFVLLTHAGTASAQLAAGPAPAQLAAGPAPAQLAAGPAPAQLAAGPARASLGDTADDGRTLPGALLLYPVLLVAVVLSTARLTANRRRRAAAYRGASGT